MGKFKLKKKNKKQEVSRVLPKTRKDIRKEKRALKKVKKQQWFSKNKNSQDEVGRFVKAPIPENEDIDQEKKPKPSNKNNIMIEENQGAKKREEKLKSQMKEKRNSQLIKANEEEDKIIKKLEKQLKLKKNKSGKLGKSFNEDGLGYILEVCDEKTMAAAVAAEKHLADTGSGSDFEEDIAIATGKSRSAIKPSISKISNAKNNDVESDDDHSDAHMDDSEDLSDDENFDSDEEESEDDKPPKRLSKNQGKLMKNKQHNSVQKQEVAKRIYKKIKNIPEDSESDEDSEFDDDLMEEEDDDIPEDIEDDSDEELGIIYTGVSSFPDDSFNRGNLTPVKEETEYELNLYRNNIEIPSIDEDISINENINPETDSEINETRQMESEEDTMLEDSDEEKMFEDGISDDEIDSEEETLNDSEEHVHHLGMDEDMENSDLESEESECSNPDCCDNQSNESNPNNKRIVVNGKIINTYGRPVADDTEPELVRCPKLDKILQNLSNSESECEQTPESSKKNTPGEHNSKSNLKRKAQNIENIDTEIEKKKVKKNSQGNSKQLKISNSAEKKQIKIKKAGSDSENMDEDNNDMSDFSKNTSDNEQSSEEKDSENEVWEDIYGRQRDKQGNVITNQTGKYVPPHMRAKLELDDSKEIIQLKRQIKGLLNKVAGSNMHWTSSQMESIYSSHSRNAVNNAFCSLWLAALVQHTVTPDRMAIEHAMLVAILHANVGSEVGAHFLQTIVKKFNDMITVDQVLENKELDNLILTISQLYNFKIFNGSLLYEILNKLLEKLNEKNVDCTLIALRNVGATLRKEDPASLKVFIHNTQEKAAKYKDGKSDGSRMKFLLDVLMAIKNNNMNKIPNYDPFYSVEMKKAMKMIIRKGNDVTALNIKFQDLIQADVKGKWWVVGSAWEGSAQQGNDPESGGSKKMDDKKQAHLLELAKQQRINTDLRRSIFCIIMSAEDYMDAFEKLQQLGLKNQQEREIIHVLLSCCLQEKVYNQYYAILAQKYCDYDRKFQMSVQYCVWDKLKEIDSCTSFQIANLGQFLTHLFNEKGLPISVLKVVQFSDLTKSTLRLMRQILLAILLQKRWQTCLEVFQRVAVSPKLHLFREGLRLFISHFLIKNSDKKENVLSEEQMTLLKERASAVDRTLQSDSKLQF